jgi:hypothetical protein
MITRNESEVTTNAEPANAELCRATSPFICGLSEWIEWRTQKLQSLRREIIGKTRTTDNRGLANSARAALRG